MENLDGCQIPCLPKISEGTIKGDNQSLMLRLKRTLASPWNYQVKTRLKRLDRKATRFISKLNLDESKSIKKIAKIPGVALQAGDLVRVRSKEEIESTLDRWNELRGCAMLAEMWQYCGTSQRVLKPMERFLDERDYKVKVTKGIILLENVMCSGTPVFGPCDRSCFFFWRQEWLEKIEEVS